MNEETPHTTETPSLLLPPSLDLYQDWALRLIQKELGTPLSAQDCHGATGLCKRPFAFRVLLSACDAVARVTWSELLLASPTVCEFHMVRAQHTAACVPRSPGMHTCPKKWKKKTESQSSYVGARVPTPTANEPGGKRTSQQGRPPTGWGGVIRDPSSVLTTISSPAGSRTHADVLPEGPGAEAVWAAS